MCSLNIELLPSEDDQSEDAQDEVSQRFDVIAMIRLINVSKFGVI